MPYAVNGTVSTDPLEGGIEITETQYTEAIDGMCEGMVVTIDGGFSVAFPPPPEAPPEIPPTLDQLRAAAFAQRDALLALAAVRIAPLQDAKDLGRATVEEQAELLTWKDYRVDLNRIDEQAEFPERIDWPVSPDTL